MDPDLPLGAFLPYHMVRSVLLTESERSSVCARVRARERGGGGVEREGVFVRVRVRES
jgi:hypothetical protein